MAIVETEKITLNPPRAVPTGMPIPLANAGIEVPPAIADDVIGLVSMIPMIVLNRFLCLVCHLRTYISLTNMPQFQSIFVTDMFVVLVLP